VKTRSPLLAFHRSLPFPTVLGCARGFFFLKVLVVPISLLALRCLSFRTSSLEALAINQGSPDHLSSFSPSFFFFIDGRVRIAPFNYSAATSSLSSFHRLPLLPDRRQTDVQVTGSVKCSSSLAVTISCPLKQVVFADALFVSSLRRMSTPRCVGGEQDCLAPFLLSPNSPPPCARAACYLLGRRGTVVSVVFSHFSGPNVPGLLFETHGAFFRNISFPLHSFSIA